MSKPKYKAGRMIYSINQFENCGSKWFKWNGKTVHRVILENQQYRVLKNSIENGYIRVAELIDGKAVEE